MSRNSFYGIDGLEIIGHGEWADPEIIEDSTGWVANYFDVEDAIYGDFVSELKYENPSITTSEIDELTESEFDEYVLNNEDLVYEVFRNHCK